MLEIPKNGINYYRLKARNNWAIEEIIKFEELIKNINNPDELKDILNTIYDYRLRFNQVISLNKSQMHKLGLRNLMDTNIYRNRSISEILEEHSNILKEKNLTIPSKEEDFIIINRINNIKYLSQKYLGKKFTKDSIEPELKSSNDDLIAIVYNTVKEIKNFLLNDSQLYSLIVLLEKKINRGKIIQILTGEGKTIIINCLAIIMVLKGHKVDLVTSTPQLAKRDCEQLQSLCSKFDISVSHNIKEDSLKYIKDVKKFKNEVYSNDIVYGTTLEYQSDILSDDYKLLNYRNKRSFDVIIIDEIDCMMVDQYNHKTMLCTSMPYYGKLLHYFTIIMGLL